MFDRSFSQIEVGTCWTSRGRTITEADLVNFACLTGDTYPLHTDREYASKSVFGKRIAHGMLVLSYANGLLHLTPGYIKAFYGMDAVRFVKPVFIGDTIHVELQVAEKRASESGGGIVTTKNEVKNQENTTVAVFVMKVLME